MRLAPLVMLCSTGIPACIGLFQLSPKRNPSKSAREIAALAGVYEKRIQSGAIDGSKYTAVDTLSIRRVSDTTIQFSLRLNFFNGHQCNLEGAAQYQLDGSFEHREPLDPKRECVLRLVPTPTAILIEDMEQQYCQQLSCGTRGAYSGASFPRALRRPPRPSAKK